MSDDPVTSLQLAVGAYVTVPSRDNYQQLVSLADAYREHWIAARAGPPAPLLRASARGGATIYERKHEITQLVYGIPVTLALQKRISPAEPEPWWVLSWRTKNAARGSNRRFYMTDDGCWMVPAQIALGIIQIMESEGGLDTQYQDQRHLARSKPAFQQA